MEPITITRIDAGKYIVGDRLYLVRIAPDRWIAGPADGGKALFEASSLEEILELAHQAVEMFRPIPFVEPPEQGRYRFEGMGQE